MSSFQELTHVADAVAATGSKLEKIRLLAELLGGLSDDDLYWATLFFTGNTFAPSSGRVMQVGFAVLQGAIQSVTGADEPTFAQEYLKWSDVGDTARALAREGRPSSGLTVAQVAEKFEQIAATPAGTAKSVVVTDLLRQLGADELRYVTKILTADLRIGLKEGLVEDALARASGVKPAEIRKAHQLVGDLGKIAVAARHGRLEALAVELFVPLKPMLASPETQAEIVTQRMGAELWLEDKFDGIRAQAHKSDDRVALFSRDLKDISAQFPEVVAALAQLPGRLILDGELLAHREGTARPFFDLQKRLGRKELTGKVLAAIPVGFFMFDLLLEAGEPLLDLPFRERRARLAGLPRVPNLYLSPLRIRPVAMLDEEFAISRARANEGLMIKHPDSVYTPGRRGMGWLKYKKPLEPLDVVVTGVEYGHGRRREVLSDYTFAVRNEETDELVNIGKAYSGLTDAEILELTAYFKEHTLQSFGRFQLVKPELVIEVAFEAIQKSARHKSGYALRFPRIVRLRPDKTPADINTLTDVARFYEQYRAVYDQPAEMESVEAEVVETA